MKKIKINNYPFDPSIKHHLIATIGFAIWVFIFLFFTEPLEISVFSEVEKFIYLPLYSFIGAISYLTILPIQKSLFKKQNEIWLFRNEVSILIRILVIGFVLMWSLFYFFIQAIDVFSFLIFIFIPAALTLFPIIILFRWGLGRYHEKKVEDLKIEIQGAGNYESLRLLFNNLIFIQSADNYIEITYLESAIIKKALIRNKLSSIATDLPKLLRTHRSYLINTSHFKQWNNTNGKYGILLFNDIEVPVSKTYLKDVKDGINLTTE